MVRVFLGLLQLKKENATLKNRNFAAAGKKREKLIKVGNIFPKWGTCAKFWGGDFLFWPGPITGEDGCVFSFLLFRCFTWAKERGNSCAEVPPI